MMEKTTIKHLNKQIKRMEQDQLFCRSAISGTINQATTGSTTRMDGTSNNNNCDSDSDSSNDAAVAAPNWELLQETLGSDALEALQNHFTTTTLDNNDYNNNTNNTESVSEHDSTTTGPTITTNQDGATSSSQQSTISTTTTTTKASAVDLPRNNREYGKKDYWEDRFAKEEEYDWLVTYCDIKTQIEPYLSPSFSILLVGCGNSTFSADLYDAGYTNIWNLDYSATVIQAMKKKHEESRPHMKWLVMDMTDMSELEDESFDVVIDKAAMDALMTNEGDVWNPEQHVVDSARRMCHHISRILKKSTMMRKNNEDHKALISDGTGMSGTHLHITFAQPHFRRKYLLGLHPHAEGEEPRTNDSDDYSTEFGWTFRVETIGGNDKSNCGGPFCHFLYIMTKEDKL